MTSARRSRRGRRSNWQSLCVQLPDGIDQKAVMQHMLDAGVSTRRGVMNSHLEDAYRIARSEGCLPASERAQRSTVILPLLPAMNGQDLDRVCALLDAIVTTLAATMRRG